jgi:tRNA-uridine 2-sulfurtransferase
MPHPPTVNVPASGPGTAPARRIVVAMSGGVDSSVAAALLKQAGHDVVGITLQLYDHGTATGRAGSCCAGQDIHDARRVAEALGIPHYVLDYESRFRTSVMTAFAASYAAGETPIPCVTCNSQIKFTELLATTRELGADRLATGHYIARIDGPAGPALHRAADAERDQSYFLFNTTRAQLERLIFPLGAMTKAEVRSRAKALALPVADKPDSQDICFVPSGRYTDIIAKLDPAAADPGDIVHVDGRLLGRHPGIAHFTVGQRKGLGIATGDPVFVVRLEPATRRVIVGARSDLLAERLVLRDLNWLGDTPLDETASNGLALHVRVRSSQPLRPARLDLEDGTPVVTLLDGEHGVAPGQACVFYAGTTNGARVLGGGFIARAEHQGAAKDTPKIGRGTAEHAGAAIPRN